MSGKRYIAGKAAPERFDPAARRIADAEAHIAATGECLVPEQSKARLFRGMTLAALVLSAAATVMARQQPRRRYSHFDKGSGIEAARRIVRRELNLLSLRIGRR